MLTELQSICTAKPVLEVKVPLERTLPRLVKQRCLFPVTLQQELFASRRNLKRETRMDRSNLVVGLPPSPVHPPGLPSTEVTPLQDRTDAPPNILVVHPLQLFPHPPLIPPQTLGRPLVGICLPMTPTTVVSIPWLRSVLQLPKKDPTPLLRKTLTLLGAEFPILMSRTTCVSPMTLVLSRNVLFRQAETPPHLSEEAHFPLNRPRMLLHILPCPVLRVI